MTAIKRFRPTFFIFTTEDTRAWTIGACLKKLQKGSCGVVLRAYNLESQARLTLGHHLAQLCHTRRFLLLVAIRDHIDLTIAGILRADGVHLPEWVARRQTLAPVLSWRHRCRRFLTVAAHGSRGLRRGQQLGADAVFISPIFSTPTHINMRPMGSIRLTRLCYTIQQPIIALGGIRFTTLCRLQHHKIVGIAIGQPMLR